MIKHLKPSLILGVGYTGENFEFWVPNFFWIDITPINSEEKEFLKNNKNSDFSALFYLPIAFFFKNHIFWSNTIN